MIIVISPVVRSLMAFIIFHQLEQTSVDHTDLVLLVAAVKKAILYHLILLNCVEVNKVHCWSSTGNYTVIVILDSCSYCGVCNDALQSFIRIIVWYCLLLQYN